MQHAKARVDHLSAEKAGAHFTECAHLRTGLKRLGLTSKEIEEAQRQSWRLGRYTISVERTVPSTWTGKPGCAFAIGVMRVSSS